MKYYLAYGSNLNKRQMQMRCPGALPVGHFMMKGYRLVFKGSKTGSYLTIEKDENSSVPIGVWEVTKGHEAALDRYEGYPTFYYKMEGYLAKMPKNKAFIYIMHEDRPYGIPSNSYLEVCQEGYKDFGFDESYLFKALEDSKEEANENK